MKFAFLLAAAFLCGCQPVQTQSGVLQPQTAQPPQWTEAHAYLADLRAALTVAYLKDRETTAAADCDSPRFEDTRPPPHLAVEACRLSIRSSADYRIEARFAGGLVWIADLDGIRQAGAEALRLLN
ncbi:hypothetical protein [Deinococcus frigens]|uniref:hypothetical protein n=1 Tax=Deinococcus frigens TaxID=249403 RepID=UPI000496E6F6|nr:hypothetical protein [Deinococcus frigens]